MNKFLKNTLFLLLSLLLLLGIFIFGILWSYSNNIPDYKFLKSYSHQYQVKYTQVMENLLQIFQKKKEYLFHLTQFQKM